MEFVPLLPVTSDQQLLEQRVAERTAELSRRVMQLETTNLIMQHITSILDLDELLQQVVDRIFSQFGYYFVGLWLVIENGTAVSLCARAGSEGEGLPRQGLRLSMKATSVIVNVCKSGNYQLVEDVSAVLDFSRLEMLADNRSELALALCSGGGIIGVLDILSYAVGEFDAGAISILQGLADQISVVIGNTQRYNAEQARRQLAESLEQTGRELSSNLDLYGMSSRVLQILAEVVSFKRGAVILESGEALRIIAQLGFPDAERARALVIPIRYGDVYQQIVASGRPLLLDDVTHESGWHQVAWLPLDRSWMGVPLIAKDKVLGMISLTRHDIAAFSPEDATSVLAFASQAAIALENARLYDELQRAYHHLERLDKTKSDFISVVAHELGTPLTVIKGYTYILKRRLEKAGDDRMVFALTGIDAGVIRMHEVVNSMLDVVKIDSDALQLLKGPTVLSDIFQRVRQAYASALEERRLNLMLVGLDALPIIYADGELLEKVFDNLVVNAIKYTPDGGAITVRGEVCPATEHETSVQIVVSDTGIGIDPQNHALIFEKFYQTGEVDVHSTGKTKFKGGGPGLGLAIAKGIVVAHGGQIWVESDAYDEERCPGSRFYVRLPGILSQSE